MEKKQAAEVHCNPKMSEFWTSIGLQKINTYWINLKILPHKLEERAQISQQVLLNSGTGC